MVKMTQIRDEKLDFERKVRIKEIEKKKKQKLEAEKDRQRLLAQFRDDHNFEDSKYTNIVM